MTAEALAGRLDAKRHGTGWQARCPAHDDAHPSLSIAEGDDGRVLLHCHARRCEPAAIVSALGLAMTDIAGDTPKATTAKPTIVATFDYRDEDDALRFQEVKFEPKDFRLRRPDGRGGWIWNLKGVRPLIFGLPDVRRQISDPEARAYRDQHGIPHDVFVGEGAKDAVALRTRGLIATTNAGGAGKWKDEHTRQLVEAGATSIVVLPDADEPGRRHAQQVALGCYSAGLTVKILDLPGLAPKADVSDYLAGPGDRLPELLALVAAAPAWTPTPAAATAATAPAATSTTKAPKAKQGRDVELEDPEPWASAVDGAVLLTGIGETFARYLALPLHASTALALWVLHAYTFDAWFASPFLAITSPAKRCGKTLTLIVLGALVPRRLFASNVTPAVLFRAIEKFSPTLLIDEADTFVRDNDELRGVLNSGHTRTTAVVIRAVGDDHDPRAFSTWCPKAIALIGTLPGTLADRAIEIGMRRRMAGEQVERLRQDRIGDSCADLRRQAARWAEDALAGLQDADPDVPAALNDRAADCWRPLLAIADAAGGPWPRRAREAALGLSGDEGDEDVGTKLLSDIRSIFTAEGHPDVLGSSVVVEQLVGMEDRPWSEWSKGRPLTTAKLARLLNGYGIYPAGNVRIGTKVVKGYRLNAFGEAWERYLGPAKALQRNKPNNDGPQSTISNRYTENDCSGLQRVTNPITTGECSAVALREGDTPLTDTTAPSSLEPERGDRNGRF